MGERQCQHCGATYEATKLADRNCGPGHWEMCPECGGMQHWLKPAPQQAAPASTTLPKTD